MLRIDIFGIALRKRYSEQKVLGVATPSLSFGYSVELFCSQDEALYAMPSAVSTLIANTMIIETSCI